MTHFRSMTGQRSRSYCAPATASKLPGNGTSTFRVPPRFRRPRRSKCRNRCSAIGAVVDIPDRAQRGDLRPGHALRRTSSLHRRSAAPLCQQLRRYRGPEGESASTEEIPTGKNLILSAAFEKRAKSRQASPTERYRYSSPNRKSARRRSRRSRGSSPTVATGCASDGTGDRV